MTSGGPLGRWGTVVAMLIACGVPAYAQEFPIDPNTRERTDRPDSQNEGLREIGTTTAVGTGELGQRQTRQDAAPNIDTIARLNTRIENRIQNRIRNRIDRNYDPTATATAPFERAAEQTGLAIRPRARRD